MRSVADVRRTPSIRRRLTIGTALEFATAACTIGWTVALALSLVAIVERTSATGPIVALVVLTASRIAVARGRTVVFAAAGEETCRRTRRLLVDRLVDEVGRSGIGTDTTLIGAAVDDLGPWTTSYLPARLAAVPVPLAVAVVIGVLDPLSVLVLLFAGPMLIALLALIGRATSARAERRLRELEWLRGLTLDMVRGIPTLRVFGRVDDGADTIRATSERFASATMDVLRTAFQTSLVIEWAATAATALVAVEVALRMTNHDLDFSIALIVLVLTPEFFSPLRRLSVEYHAGRAGDAGAARIDVILAEPVLAPTPAARHIDLRRPPTIVLSGVDVALPGERPRLTGVDLRIESDEILGIAGPSGAGKSTIASLIIGTLAPTSGTVTLDGIPIDDIDLAARRDAISFVSQRPFLLAGTIADNIAVADPTADRRQIDRVTALARVDEFARRLPRGLDTPIGPGGTRLSGGQRQRIAIARSMLRDAPLVVLDEFTAHLDHDLEGEIVSAMADHLRGRTAIVIAHRVESLTLADRVIELVDGRVVTSDVGR